MREVDSPIGSTVYVPTGANRAGGAAERDLARGVVLCDLVWEVSHPSGSVAALYHSRTYAQGPVSLDSCAHELALPLVV